MNRLIKVSSVDINKFCKPVSLGIFFKRVLKFERDFDINYSNYNIYHI